MDKLEKQKKKTEKEHKKVMNEIKDELKKCYVKVDKHVAENTVLMEEVKTLRKLRQVKENLKDAAMKNNPV